MSRTLDRAVDVTSKNRPKTERNTRTPQAKGLRDHIAGRIARIADAMARMSSWHLKERWNLRITDLRLLNVLDGEAPLSVNEIGRRALVDQAWVSRSLRALEAMKFVERRSDPQDSRLTLISLTKRGRETVDEFRPYAAWSERVLLKGVDEAQLKALLDQVEANTQSLIDVLEDAPKERPRKK
jgi:DNA-binding MarR family transcriptional regulator